MEAILSATRELLDCLVEKNDLREDNVAAVIFTTTKDLNAEFPARAAREMGWTNIALMCAHEMDVPDAPSRCIRVLVLLNTEKAADELVNVYLNGTEKLRMRGATA